MGRPYRAEPVALGEIDEEVRKMTENGFVELMKYE